VGRIIFSGFSFQRHPEATMDQFKLCSGFMVEDILNSKIVMCLSPPLSLSNNTLADQGE
jgi:hypothetical protein